jgi:hypothetical protein
MFVANKTSPARTENMNIDMLPFILTYCLDINTPYIYVHVSKRFQKSFKK